MGKAVNGDAVVDDIIPHFPAKTGIFGNQLLDVLEALRVFGVPLDRTDAVPFVIISHCDFSFFWCYLFSKNASIAVLAACAYRVSGCRAAKLSFAKRLFAECTEYLVPFNFNCQAS